MKSFVTMEQKVCSVCGTQYDTGALLMDKRMSNRFDHKTVTGMGVCPDHQKELDAGFVLLIEVDESLSKGRGIQDVFRTGRILQIKRDAWDAIFDNPAPPGGIAMINREATEAVQNLYTKETGSAPEVRA